MPRGSCQAVKLGMNLTSPQTSFGIPLEIANVVRGTQGPNAFRAARSGRILAAVNMRHSRSQAAVHLTVLLSSPETILLHWRKSDLKI